jgi:radical SAM protein with 4Fe4S-binding SPASM domain
MDYKLYRRIIDEGVENRLWGLKLSYRGESLLHPKVVEMVDYAKKRGILDVYFNTNGTLLTKGKCLRLIQAGLDRISVSVEGTDPVAFERERIGAKFYKILNNIDNLLELRQRENVSHPKIRIQTVRLPGIDLVEYKNFWESHCDEVAVVDFKDTKNRKLGMVHNNWACPQLWQRMTIEWNGAIMPCNNDDYRLLSPGNVKTKTVSSSWHDPMVNRARDLHRSGQSHLLKACDGCPWRTTQLNKIGLPQ